MTWLSKLKNRLKSPKSRFYEDVAGIWYRVCAEMSPCPTYLEDDGEKAALWLWDLERQEGRYAYGPVPLRKGDPITFHVDGKNVHARVKTVGVGVTVDVSMPTTRG